MNDLSGGRVLVTAAGAGIGHAISRAAARAGAEVLAVDIDAAALEALAADGIATAPLDVTDAAAVTALIEARGPFAGLVNAVGWVHHGDIAACGPEDWRRAFAINVDSMYLTMRAALPGMQAAGSGSIVNVASVASSIKGFANRVAYGASKAAVIGLTKAVAVDNLRTGVRVNAICPGTVDSPSLRQRIRDLGTTEEEYEAARAMFMARQPNGRLGKPEEIAPLAVYLLSADSAFMTGQAVAIDGGIMA